jgi:hypothetical protein
MLSPSLSSFGLFRKMISLFLWNRNIPQKTALSISVSIYVIFLKSALSPIPFFGSHMPSLKKMLCMIWIDVETQSEYIFELSS